MCLWREYLFPGFVFSFSGYAGFPDVAVLVVTVGGGGFHLPFLSHLPIELKVMKSTDHGCRAQKPRTKSDLSSLS